MPKIDDHNDEPLMKNLVEDAVASQPIGKDPPQSPVQDLALGRISGQSVESPKKSAV
jgi:hypothetical protein